jgi:hypothetical protein
LTEEAGGPGAGFQQEGLKKSRQIPFEESIETVGLSV